VTAPDTLIRALPWYAYPVWNGAAIVLGEAVREPVVWTGAHPLAPGDAIRMQVTFNGSMDLLVLAEWEERPMFGTETV
jgi:hypothetical protein